VVTEVGRQPRVVYRLLRTADAVNPAPGLVGGLALVGATYLVLTVATIYVLRRMARSGRAGAAAVSAPQEAPREARTDEAVP
jgi:cytochrome d ubiquinol oxidase subunit I